MPALSRLNHKWKVEWERWRTEPMMRVALRARLLRPYRLRQFHEFGAASIIHRPDWVYGADHMAVGRGVLILHGAWLAVERVAWGKPAPVLRIGDGVAVRPYCTIAAAESIVIEDNVVLSSFSTVLDSDHTWEGGHPNVLYSPLKVSPTRIGEGTWVGERVAVLRGSDIGRFCVIGANSVVRGTIPDFSVAVGAPARVVGTTRGEGPHPAEDFAPPEAFT